MSTHQPAGDLLTGHHSSVEALAFSPDDNYLASGSCGEFDATGHCIAGEIYYWNLRTGGYQVYPTVHNAFVLQLEFTPDGKYLVSRGENRIVLWDAAGAQVAHIVMDIPDSQVLSVFTLTPDGSMLATGVCETEGGREYDYCKQSDVILWDVAQGQLLKRISGPQRPVYNWVFSADGRFLASAGCEKILLLEANICEQGHIQLWDISTGQNLTSTFTGHTDWVVWLAFIKNDTALISASFDKSIRVWDAATGDPLVPPITDLTADISEAKISPDETLLATVHTQESNIRLWDVAKLLQVDSPRTVEVFTRAPSYLLSVAVNPEETMVAAVVLPVKSICGIWQPEL